MKSKDEKISKALEEKKQNELNGCTFIPMTNTSHQKKQRKPVVSGEILTSCRTSQSGLRQMLCTFDRAAGNIAEREAMGSQDMTLVETYDNRDLTLEPLS